MNLLKELPKKLLISLKNCWKNTHFIKESLKQRASRQRIAWKMGFSLKNHKKMQNFSNIMIKKNLQTFSNIANKPYKFCQNHKKKNPLISLNIVKTPTNFVKHHKKYSCKFHQTSCKDSANSGKHCKRTANLVKYLGKKTNQSLWKHCGKILFKHPLSLFYVFLCVGGGINGILWYLNYYDISCTVGKLSATSFNSSCRSLTFCRI